MKKILFVLSCLLMLNNGCSYISNIFNSNKTQITLKRKIKTENIAVLNFTKSGSFSYSNLSKLTADKLTEQLFITGKFNTIDRSRVNEAIAKVNIQNTEVLSQDQILQIGFKLKAEYLIIGSISETDKFENIENENERRLRISFRIISIDEAEIIGVINAERNIKTDINNDLELLLKDVVEKIRDYDG